MRPNPEFCDPEFLCQMQKDQCTYSSDCRFPRRPAQCCDDLAYNYIGNGHWAGQCPFTAFKSSSAWMTKSFFVLKDFLSQQGYCKKCLSCHDCKVTCSIWNNTRDSNISSNNGSYFDVWSGKCAQCPVGQFLDRLGCTPCSRPSYSYFTGSGTVADDCPWSCNSGYYKQNQLCAPCTTQFCKVGEYRANVPFMMVCANLVPRYLTPTFQPLEIHMTQTIVSGPAMTSSIVHSLSVFPATIARALSDNI